MNLYLLLIVYGTKSKAAWQAGENAGVILDRVVDRLGMDVIEIVLMPPSMHETIKEVYPDLDYMIKGLQQMTDYKPI